MTMTAARSDCARAPVPVAASVEGARRPRLVDLLAPIDAGAFYRDHWAGGRPFLSRPCAHLVSSVKAVPALAGVDALLAGYTGEVSLLGPGPSRGTVAASGARAALDAGRNLYLPRVAEAVPAVEDLFKAIAFDLGVAPWQLHVEAFAGRAGGVSSRHFDHDVNFQILLDGEKEWLLEPNRNIDNPLRPFHPTRAEGGEWTGFTEEAYAHDPRMPMAFDPPSTTRVVAIPGTVLYVPRGLWHETRSLTDTWGINLVIKGTTWAESLANALAARLLEDPRFRAYADGFRGRTLGAEHAARRVLDFEDLKRAGESALGRLSLLDVDLAPMGERRCAWSPEARLRAVVGAGDSWSLVAPHVLAAPLALTAAAAPIARRLCAFQHPFLLKHARAALPEVDPESIYNLIALLAQKKLVSVRNPHDRA